MQQASISQRLKETAESEHLAPPVGQASENGPEVMCDRHGPLESLKMVDVAEALWEAQRCSIVCPEPP